MRQYEMTYLVSDKVSDADMNAATGKINALITSHKGKVLGEENWGRRKLAYAINKQEFATYITLNFEMDPSELGSINRELRLSKDVVRSLIIVKDFGKEKLTLTADEVAETTDIEEVVGGERSFEAVEGETEESYGLMAKRDDDSEDSDDEKTVPAKEEESEEPKSKSRKPEETDAKDEAKEIADEAVETEAVEEKPKKKAAKKETEEAKGEKKPAAKKEPKAKESKPVEDKSEAAAEADRLAKLDEEIEGILGDDL